MDLTPIAYSNTFSALNIAAGTVKLDNTAASNNPIGLNQASFTGAGTLEYTGTAASVLNNGFLFTHAGTFNVTNSAGQLTIGGISGAGALTKLGSGTLTLNGSSTGFTGGIIQSAWTLAFASTLSVGTGTAPVTLLTLTNGGSASRTVTANSGVTATINGALVNSGTGTIPNFIKAGGGTLSLQNIRLGDGTTGSVSVAAGRLTIGGDTSRQASKSTGLPISSGATLDLRNNWYVDEYSSTSPISTLTGYLTGGQITTTSTILKQSISAGSYTNPSGTTFSYTAGSYNAEGLGIVEETQAGGITGGAWHGRTVDSTSVLMGWAYLGDTNLDGIVDTSDLNHLHHALDTPTVPATWYNGDFNHDGAINGSDLALYYAGLALYNSNGSGPLAIGGGNVVDGDGSNVDTFAVAAAVPEPSAIALMFVGVGMVLRRGVAWRTV